MELSDEDYRLSGGRQSKVLITLNSNLYAKLRCIWAIEPLSKLAITGFGLLDLPLGTRQEAGCFSITGRDGPQDAMVEGDDLNPPLHADPRIQTQKVRQPSDRVMIDSNGCPPAPGTDSRYGSDR